MNDHEAPTVSDEAAEALARAFHEAYERLAPSHGYETRKASAVPWEDVPAANKALMIAVCAELRPMIVAEASADERHKIVEALRALATGARQDAARYTRDEAYWRGQADALTRFADTIGGAAAPDAG